MLGTIDDVYMTFPASTGTTLSSRVIKLHPAIRAREQMALVDELRSAANYMGEATTSGDDISAGKVMKECTKSVIGAGTSPAVLAALFDKQKDAEGTALYQLSIKETKVERTFVAGAGNRAVDAYLADLEPRLNADIELECQRLHGAVSEWDLQQCRKVLVIPAGHERNEYVKELLGCGEFAKQPLRDQNLPPPKAICPHPKPYDSMLSSQLLYVWQMVQQWLPSCL